MKTLKTIYALLSLLFSLFSYSQDIELYQQFNGRYDYVAIGNTMNFVENGFNTSCTIASSSSASLDLQSNQNIIAAYLYWAGSGPGDFDIDLNGIPITADRTFSDTLDPTRVFFAAFKDVTDIILGQGSTTYTVSELDLSSVIAPYCPSGTNFAGWAITIIYEDANLPLNQVNVYDGLQSVPEQLSIELNSINVIDTNGAKIGFVAWEGDTSLAVNEQLTINGMLIGNPPLNPTNNAFNGTNSFTGASNLYNMDIDFYSIENTIQPGDTSATIALTSGQDFVMINNIITVLNSQLPDATLALNNYSLQCNLRTLDLEVELRNYNATALLPQGTNYSIYANNTILYQGATQNDLAINESEIQFLELSIPDDIPDTFTLILVIDETDAITEINENNNEFYESITLLNSPEIIELPQLLSCDIGFNTSEFNLNNALQGFDTNAIDNATYFHSIEDLYHFENEILIPQNYTNNETPETIYVRIENNPCYEIYAFKLLVENCPPHVPQGFSPNDDGFNDFFNIQGLYNIFESHELYIYNRYGTLIFLGDNNKKWYGIPNQGIINQNEPVPVGTYFYVLKLNDIHFSDVTGWVYVNY